MATALTIENLKSMHVTGDSKCRLVTAAQQIYWHEVGFSAAVSTWRHRCGNRIFSWTQNQHLNTNVCNMGTLFLSLSQFFNNSRCAVVKVATKVVSVVDTQLVLVTGKEHKNEPPDFKSLGTLVSVRIATDLQIGLDSDTLVPHWFHISY